jgi:hypothetical protein
MPPTVAEIRADSADLVMAAMAGQRETAYALAECDRLFRCCRTPFEAVLIPALAIWATVTGGEVACREHLYPFGRVGFLVEHPRFRQSLVIEVGATQRWVPRDRALQMAGYVVARFGMAGMSSADIRAALHEAFQAVDTRLH